MAEAKRQGARDIPGRVGGVVQKLLSREYLVIQVSEYCVRGLVIRKGVRGVEYGAFREVYFDVSGYSLRIKLSRLFEELGKNIPAACLYIGDEVQMLSLDLPFFPQKKMGSNTLRMRDLAYAEAQELQGESHGAYVSAYWVEEEPEVPLVAMDEPLRREALVAVVGEQFYSGVAGVLRGFNKKLVAMTSPDVLGFSLCGKTVATGGVYVVVEWQPGEVCAALVDSGVQKKTVRVPVDRALEQHEQVAQVCSLLVEDPACITEVVVGGEGVESLVWDGSVRGDELVLKKWDCSQDLPRVHGDIPLPPRYMVVCAGAANWFGEKEASLFCTDAQPLGRRLRANIHALPFVVLVVLVMGLLFEYGQLQRRQYDIGLRVESLEEEKEELEERQQQKRRLDRNLRTLTDSVAVMKDRMDLLRGDMPLRLVGQRNFLEDLVLAIPPEVQLMSLVQDSDELYYVEGRTRHVQSVQSLPLHLRDIQGVRDVRLERSEERLHGRGGYGSGRERWYYARLRVHVSERGAL